MFTLHFVELSERVLPHPCIVHLLKIIADKEVAGKPACRIVIDFFPGKFHKRHKQRRARLHAKLFTSRVIKLRSSVQNKFAHLPVKYADHLWRHRLNGAENCPSLFSRSTEPAHPVLPIQFYLPLLPVINIGASPLVKMLQLLFRSKNHHINIS